MKWCFYKIHSHIAILQYINTLKDNTQYGTSPYCLTPSTVVNLYQYLIPLPKGYKFSLIWLYPLFVHMTKIDECLCVVTGI